MARPVRWLLRIALGLFALAVILIAAGFFLLDTFARQVILRRTEAATGMKAAIGSVHIGLRSVTIRKLELYDPPPWGNSVCFDMPELRLEYDRAALRAHQLHFKLVRVDLARVAVMQETNGSVKFGALNVKPNAASHEFFSNGFVFTGIDTLDLSLGSLHISNPATGRQSDVNFGIQHEIFHDVSAADIPGIELMLALRGVSSKSKGVDVGGLLNGLGH